MSYLYKDLDERENKVELERLREVVQNYETENKTLNTTIKELNDQIALLIQDRNQLETNMVALYNTALREIQRKDREIEELRNAQITQSKRLNRS
jgi:predicted RNase H-like nuclease (RuvC/YqgF family)